MSKNHTSHFKALQYSPHKELRALESTFYTSDSEEPRGPLTASLKVSRAISDILASSLTQTAMSHADGAFRRFADDYQAHMDLGANVFELEANFMEEKQKSEYLECKWKDTERMYLQERKYAQELDRENIKLRKNCRQNEDSMKHYESKIVNILRNATGVNFENNNLCQEIKRLSEAYNVKLREIEEKYSLEVKAFKEETEKLKVQLKAKDLEHTNVIKNIKRDHQEQVKRLETTIRDKERVIVEFEAELKSSKNFQKVVRLQWEDELKRKLSAVKDVEQEKYEPILKELEEKVEMLELHSHDLSKELFSIQETIILKDNIINDLKLQFNSKLIPLNTEIAQLKDEISAKYIDIEEMHVEVAEKNDTISRLEIELITKEETILKNMKSYDREVDRLSQKNESDIRKFQAYEDKMKHKLVELAGLIEASEQENERLRVNARKLRQDMAVKVDQALVQTFIGYENGNIDLL